MLNRVILCACIVFGLTAATLPYSIYETYRNASEVNAACFVREPDRTTYVSTGDIDAMWLRDSSVQALSYVTDRDLTRGVIARQERLIAMNAYANAFLRDYKVAEEKFELDSLAFPVKLVARYVKTTGDRSVLDASFRDELRTILETFATEMNHDRYSGYRRNEHTHAENINLIWSAYRPSDDPQTYNYNIPENMLAAVALRTMAGFFRDYRDFARAQRAEAMAGRIENAVRTYGVFDTKYGRIYAYEVDGLGRALFMDDANMPSLLSIPLIGFPYDKGVYARTRSFILSGANPYYYRGRYAAGVGSPHTPQGFVWPMSLIVEYRTAEREDERSSMVRQLAVSHAGDGALHESFDANNPRRFTRSRFGWVNALFEQTFSQ